MSCQVSIIVPVFNAGGNLSRSVESLLDQSLKAIEIVLVNDASTDGTARVIDQLAKVHPNIVAVHLPHNVGVHEARLVGLKKSTAPWIGFLDSDDFARQQMFETLYLTAINQGVDIVVCGSDRVTEQRKVIAPKLRFQRSQKITQDVFARFCAFEFGTGTLWNKLYKRSVIEPWFDLHFPWRQRINEDLLLNIGCFCRAQSIYLLKESLHEYTLAPGSVTSQMDAPSAYAQLFKAYALAVISFQHLGEPAILSIIDMYRLQLGWSCYQVENAAELSAHKSDIEEAVSILGAQAPFALAAVAARKAHQRVGARLALASIVHHIKRRSRRLIKLD